MFAFALLTLFGHCFAGSVDYHAKQGNPTLIALPDNPYFKLHYNGSDYPTHIEYLQDIDRETPLMIRVIFGDKHGPLDPVNAENTRISMCEILERDLRDPMSSQRRYSMALSLGLEGQRCPIKKGIKPIEPYLFPTEFTTKDLGCGERYYAMRVEDPDHGVEGAAIMELHVPVNLEKADGTCTESSSSVVSLPSILAGIVLLLQVSKFIKFL